MRDEVEQEFASQATLALKLDETRRTREDARRPDLRLILGGKR